ncbi:hypothetical protein EC973_008666 [Apophysomyces ossiformis]|uniref:Acid phosphatase n=1 Tax=Apophysomyces ossiformis TaxID=679940 RepID=A0A8H7BTD7_9FUNG|nr:hypothetical protein EC973_008666 [Apophysomyces ossiformis]
MYRILLLCLAFCPYLLALPVIQKRDNIVPGKHFDRVVIFIFENQKYSVAAKDKYLSSLASRYNGVVLTNYLAIQHPSQPNYIALTSGSTDGTNDDDESNINRKSIVDLLESKNISWKSYQEDYPGNCNKKMDIGSYARKHNPFISYTTISKNKDRCAKIVNSKELDRDIENGQVPQYVFYTPNIDNDAHDTNMTYAGKWFQKYLEARIQKPAFNKNTMFVVTFDEDDGSTKNNKVMTILFGPDFHRNSTAKEDDTRYNHYSLLRTIEDNWNLGDFGLHDHDASPITL